jgi:hypothetical protein
MTRLKRMARFLKVNTLPRNVFGRRKNPTRIARALLHLAEHRWRLEKKGREA